MTQYRAIFCRLEGLEEHAVGDGYWLIAESLVDAEDEALRIDPPAGSNFVKILDDARVVKRLGFSL